MQAILPYRCVTVQSGAMRHHPIGKHLPLLALLIAASAMRMASLTSIPPGMTFDEIAQAEAALGGASNWSALSPITALFSAIQSASLSLAGHNLIGIRLPAALCGLLTISFVYAWACRAYSRDIALIAGGFLGVSFWPVMISRIGLAAALPAMLAAALSWLAVRVSTRPAKIAVAVSIAIFVLAHAVSWQAANIDNLLSSAERAILLWTHRGDPFYHLNVGELPVFNIGVAVIFIMGLLAVPAKPGRLARTLPLFWIALGWLNAAFTEPDRGFQTASMALPATYAALALGFDFLGKLIAERIKTPGWQPIVMSIIIVLAGTEASWRAFTIGPANPQARRDFNTEYFQIATWLDGEPAETRAAVATTEPHRIPPALFEFVPHGSPSVLWFDPAFALAIPSGDATRVIIPSGAVVNPRLDTVLDQADATPVVHYTAGNATYTVYALPEPDDLRQLLKLGDKGTWVSDVLAFPPDDPGGVRRPIALPVQFGDVLELVGYRAPVSRQVGQNLPITILWRVKRAADSGEALSIFAHLLTADGQLAAQRDLLAVPPSGWQPGDSFLQLQDISLDGVAPGKYHLQVGVYIIDGARFPVMLDGAPVGDRLLLEPVEITP